jgi:hypothetical protein
VVANVAVAIYVLGSYSLSYYFRGERGVQRDHTKAVELYTSSAELGCSHNNLAGVYHEPGGKKKKDNFHYNYKVAAMAGDEAPRYQIGAHEFVSNKIDRAMKHWTIAASAGEHKAMHELITIFRFGRISRESIDLTLTSYNNSCAKMRSEARDAFDYCHCLRNVAFPPNAVFGDNILDEATDLLLLFSSIAEIIREMQNRFDGLPVHSLVYFQSYYQGELQRLITSGNELDPTGNEQDCLGITPLHILTCSSEHNLELYQLIVENYSTNLIIEDGWGATPLLYAFWGGASTEIIKFFLQSYQSLYPDYVFNWTMMVETMGRCDTPKERIENLLHVKQMHCPEQPIDWVYLLNKFAEHSNCAFSGGPYDERMRFLFTCGLSDHVEALEFRLWRNHIKNMIHTATFAMRGDNSVILHEIRSKLVHFEDELTKLKEVTTILELALWKMNMSKNGHQDRATQSQKKMKADDSSIRSQNRVTSGANVVIGHVLPFLINADGFFD